MQVITLESDVWSNLLINLDEIRSLLMANQKKQPLTDVWLTIEEAMALLKISKRTLQTYRDEGMIGFTQIKGKIYFKATDINDFLERHYHNPFSNNKNRLR